MGLFHRSGFDFLPWTVNDFLTLEGHQELNGTSWHPNVDIHGVVEYPPRCMLGLGTLCGGWLWMQRVDNILYLLYWHRCVWNIIYAVLLFYFLPTYVPLGFIIFRLCGWIMTLLYTRCVRLYTCSMVRQRAIIWSYGGGIITIADNGGWWWDAGIGGL